ncbi:MAG: hypothetical protein NC489_31015 [Ruminococcus flavefaciens]|nr:hypothetical protein [Ruminococcus flavefaciens]
MKTITSMLVISVFIYIVYKRRLCPVLNKGKNKKHGLSAARIGDTDAAPSASPVNNPPGYSYGFRLDTDIRYEVMVFDYKNSASGSYFADRIESRLSVMVSDMVKKGCPYRIDFITLDTVLIVLVTYLAAPKPIPSDVLADGAS